jgi:hypothetical protein
MFARRGASVNVGMTSYRTTVLTHIFREPASLANLRVDLQYSELIRSASLIVLTFPLHWSVREKNLIVWLCDVPHRYFFNTGDTHMLLPEQAVSLLREGGGECTHIKTPSVQSLT